MLTQKQRGVLAGMIAGGVLALLIVPGAALFDPLGYSADMALSARLALAMQAVLAPAACLLVGIARLAGHRFFTPEDIDGGGLTSGSERARLLQSLLQNTLEQAVLAIAVYLAWAVTMPASSLSVVPLAGWAFVAGRLLFFAGYKRGAPARSFGFTLTFYPSLLMVLALLGHLLAGV